METTTAGLVLREVNYKEADKILTVLTPEGKLTVAARGARRKGSRITACTQLFAYSEMELFTYRDRTSMNGGETVEIFPGLRRDIELMSLGAYFMELLEAVTQENEDSRALLSLALNSLYALDTLKKPQKVVKPAFELRLMCLTGFAPMVENCAVCGEGFPENARFNVTQGVLHCAACREHIPGGISMPVSPGTLAAIRHIIRCDIRKLFSFTASEGTLDELGNVSEAYIYAQLDRGFHTLDFYKGLFAL